jgi:hypothetical protein
MILSTLDDLEVKLYIETLMSDQLSSTGDSAACFQRSNNSKNSIL